MISKNHELGDSVHKKWRTAVPLWPDCAQKATPGRPGACPRVPWELHGSAKAGLIAMEKWTQANNHKKMHKNTTFFKNCKNERTPRTGRIECVRRERRGGQTARTMEPIVMEKHTHAKIRRKIVKTQKKTKNMKITDLVGRGPGESTPKEVSRW